MRIGLLGPSDGDAATLREAIEFLLDDMEVDQAVYLGLDEDTVDAVVRDWVGADPSDEAFLADALEQARSGTPDTIEALLERRELVEQLAKVRKLPTPPTRAVEMLADRILLFVNDKSVLDEEDIANANLIAYGKSAASELRRFGPRYFLTPGPLSKEQVAVVELEADGQVSLALFEISGVPVWRETMARRTSKVKLAR
ncbi:MAG: hypothetical protein VYE22_37310 [Myxococcota bacterium]|nr:hypothetical protein [Myxococcota bacterium]